ncbi:MAG: hypothetical protein EB122_03150 [Actinobacteria bacterium]|jgi:hypothetical protein|nr:hypothetical protein [Actinomycetota bacterium]
MFDDFLDRQKYFGLLSSCSLGVLVQLLASGGKLIYVHDLIDYFADGIHDLSWTIHELHTLDFIVATPAEVNGVPTSLLEITFRGHAFLSLFAWELIENYQSYLRDQH